MTEEDKLGIEREVEILKKSNHPFIIKFYEKFIHEEHICFVTELATCGNLENLENKTHLTED